MSSKDLGGQGGGLDDATLALLRSLVENVEPKVDRHLDRLGRASRNRSPEVILGRLDKFFMAAAAGAGLAQGAGGASRKVRGGLARTARRASAAALLGAGALYVLARARVQEIPAGDQRVQEALRSVAMIGASIPLAQGVIDTLGRFGRPSIGVPRDPRTVAIIAAGGAVGGWAGVTAGRAIIDAVNDAFSGIVEGTTVEDDPTADDGPGASSPYYQGRYFDPSEFLGPNV